MKIAINKIHFPVSTLGYGRRISIWMQGCSIRCKGCVSRDTWNRDSGYEVELDQLLAQCEDWLRCADGVTISGGEPFDQPEALRKLLREVRELNKGDLLVYTGYGYGVISEKYPDILSGLDVVITEPYRADAGDSLILRGSDNQRIHLLTTLARDRYPENIDRKKWNGERRLDMVISDDEVWLAGIPKSGDMARLKAKLADLGFDCHTSDEPEVRA